MTGSGGQRELRLGVAGFYYLHPLLAGPLDEWDRHFARIRGMEFNGIVLAPLFAPGPGGNLFASADHRSLHPELGSGDAAAALAAISERAAGYELSLILDLALTDAVSGTPEAAWELGAEVGLFEQWSGLLGEWLDLGLCGFRCRAAHDVPPGLWRRLIEAARTGHPDAVFLAFTHGGAPEAVAGLVDCGFDAAAASSCWWDFCAGWIDEDTERVERLGAVIALPEPLFGERAAAMGVNSAEAGRAIRRALELAVYYAPAWMMPMGFEFGAADPLARNAGDPRVFASLAAEPAFDLCAEIADRNAIRRREPGMFAGAAARLVSPPGDEIAVLLRGARRAPRFVLACNPSLAHPARIPAAGILPALGTTGGTLVAAGDRRRIGAGCPIGLEPGAAEVFAFEFAPPIMSRVAQPNRLQCAVQAPRIAIEAVSPAVDGGRFPARRIAGEMVEVEATLISDGHALLAADVLWRAADGDQWERAEMVLLGNDRYRGSFPVARVGRYLFTIEAWQDDYASLIADIGKRHAAGASIALELDQGLALLGKAAAEGSCAGAELAVLSERFASGTDVERLALLTRPETVALMRARAGRDFLTRLDPLLPIEAERPAAGFGSWYELFPRSQSGDPARHGTFADVIARLPAIRAMGFDVVYLPPVHPIGRINRKGRNNAPQALANDPGSPWAIGAAEGGHDAVHPALGTLVDFRHLVSKAAEEGLEIALDFAVQCAPDHPWVRLHPEWFEWRSDGSIRYAENPPKRYEDVVNVAFYAPGAVPSLWRTLRDVVQFWIDQGVRIFRVDNPHTKPLAFWAWLIEDIRGREPDVIFLAEAFTRPGMMYQLAKIGFSQSYSYFTWRNTKEELTRYFTELAMAPVAEFFRPHLFVNTPDINPFFLQHSGRPGFLIRAALAATLSGLWGVYNGFELCEAAALPGREEYLDSEKYQLRAWDWNRPGNIKAEIARLNQIRRANPALRSHRGLEFLNAFDANILCYARKSTVPPNTLLVAVNLDPENPREAEIEIPLWYFGLPDDGSIAAEELMHGEHLVWHGKRQRIGLDPGGLPFAIWRLDQPLASRP
ncbi:MAG: maltotransferase domain-containing protein [Acetobacteraceae bacterium]